MADNMQSEFPIDVASTADSQGPGTDLSGIGTSSTRQDFINGSSSRNLLPNSRTNNDFELLWGLRKYLVLLGVLAVGVTYNAGLTPPGGFWALNKDGHHAGELGRALSLNNILRNVERENSLASYHQSSVHLTDTSVEDNAPEPQDQPADNQQVPDIKQGEPHEEYAAAFNHQISFVGEVVSNSYHPTGNNQQSLNIKDVLSNREGHSTDGPICANIKEEDVFSSRNPTVKCQHSESTKYVVPNLEYGSTNCQQVADVEVARSSTEQEHPSPEPHDQPVDNQQVAGMMQRSSTDDFNMTEPQDQLADNQQVARQKSSTDDFKMTVLSVEKNISVSHSSNGRLVMT